MPRTVRKKGSQLSRTDAREIGDVPWSDEELKSYIDDFFKLYKSKIFDDNRGGMSSCHMFYFYFIMKKFNFENIIESGVWKGQGSWFIENTLPESKLYCIEIEPRFIQYKCENATYLTTDFTQHEWKDMNKEKTLCFFDDHQNAYDRVKSCFEKGFKHVIFEDNYPLTKGDCLSIKKFFDLDRNKKFNLAKSEHKGIYEPPLDDLDEKVFFLKKHIKTYYEFPPLFNGKTTRWGDEWNKFPVKEPLFEKLESEIDHLFKKDHKDYTYFCYIELH